MNYYKYETYEFLDDSYKTCIDIVSNENASIYTDVKAVCVLSNYTEFESLQDSKIKLTKITKTAFMKLVENSEIYKAELKTLISTKDYLLKTLKNNFENSIKYLHDDTPQSEIASWGYQEKEARAYKADVSSPTPVLSTIATQRKIPLEMLVEKVIEKADKYLLASSKLIAQRQRIEDVIKIATSLKELENISLELSYE